MKEYLTGKTLEDFEKWYNKEIHEEDEQYNYYLSKFWQLHPSMQWGVLVDFFFENKVFISYDPVPIIMGKKHLKTQE